MRRSPTLPRAEAWNLRRSRSRHPFPRIVPLVLLAIVGLSGRTSAGDGGEPLAGGVATRIVSLAPSVTEIVFAIGAGDRLVGVSSFCDYPAEVDTIPRVGSFTKPSIEAIIAARPDIVVAARGPATMSAVESVRRLGVPVLVIGDVTLEDVWKAIADIGRHTGRVEAAARIAAEMRRRLDAVQARLAGAPRRRVLVVVGQTPLIVAGGGTFVDDLIRIAGGVNVAADTGHPWPRLSLETVLSRAPEVIIDSALGHEDGADRQLWSRFPTLPAVRDGRVYAYRSFAALRGGPRLADAAEEFARLIHPECSPEYSPENPGETGGEGGEGTNPTGPRGAPVGAGATGGTSSYPRQVQEKGSGER